ncbi:hypothetical protein [Nitrosomonas sp.]|uniref:hypothetical protein n=1 Tax=Nitrosomonas sp. TaxID=42353 RepID=UPI0027301191|nr:hypothetical protein [Nitrosomonas sp.]MDP2225720.1 hypothetical protein [Nitrosomonas sp.]
MIRGLTPFSIFTDAMFFVGLQLTDGASLIRPARALKHGHVRRVADWPYSTFHQYVARGIYPMDWCGDANSTVGSDV